MPELAIDIKNLSKSFKDLIAVNDISLQVPKGSIFGFIGSNGSGKTTTIRMICGLLTPTNGGGTCLGLDISTNHYELKRKIGYVTQKFSYYSKLTVLENLNFVAGIYKIDKPKENIDKIIKDLQLERYRNSFAKNLSGGYLQLLSLACALVHEPELLVLDEPTSGVDPKMRKYFWEYLHNLSKTRGTTVLITTHYMDEVERCQQLVYIHRGKILYNGITEDIIPFSKLLSYLATPKQNVNITDLVNAVNKDYRNVLCSYIGNNARITSKDSKTLDEIIKNYNNYNFIKAQPSFEEIFINLAETNENINNK